MALTKRSVKGTSLTYAEMDANFTHLGGDGSYVFPATDGTANHVLATDGNGQLSFVAQSGGGGGIALTDLSVGTEQAASGDGGIGYDNTTGVFTYAPPDLSSYLTTVAFSDLTGKPTTIAGYGITDAFDGATSSLTGNIDLATQVTGTLPVGNMAATALTTVQTATDETAQLALTAEEGDVVVRTDENKTYMHNGGSAGTMADYTLLATPTDAVTSVDGNTGAVTTLQLGTSSTTALAGDTTFAFADITSKPTTISGYGITDDIVTSDSSIDAQPVKQLYSNQSAFPSASTWHGALAHSHSDGAMFFAHGGSWVQLANDSDIPTAVSSLTNDSNYLTTVAFADLTGKPTTIAGYGITDALQLGTTSTTALAGDTTFAFSDITSKPTTISGYGITDALAIGTTATTAMAGNTTFAFADITSKPTTISGYGITDALEIGTSSTTAMAGDTTFAFADITSKPTTISGYGITDALAIGTTSTTAMAGDTTFAFADITSKPTTISGYGITDALAIGTSATTAMAGNTALSAIGGSLDLSSQVTGTLPVGNMAATALTTVQTAANQAAQLALTTQEGDVVVRTDENKTYMRNSGTADPHDMTNFTLLATPTDAVTSVDGNTGAVTTLQIGTSATTAMAGNTTFAFSDITSKPTTISGYGITDALAIGTTSTTAMAGDTTFAFADITSKPTTLSGYGITDALASNTTSFGGSASSISLGTHSGTGTQTINIGGAVIGGASTNIKNIYIGNGAHNGGQTNIYIGPSSNTTTATTNFYHGVNFNYGQVNINATTNPTSGPKLLVSRNGGSTRSEVTPATTAAIFVDDSSQSLIQMGAYWAGTSQINFGRGPNSSNVGHDADLGAIGYNNYSNYLYLRAAGAERMRINYAGNVLIGTTSVGSYGAKLRVNGRIECSTGITCTSNGSQFQMGGNYGGATIEARSYTTYSTSAQMIIKLASSSGTEYGSIKIAGAATQFNTSSDERMKENIQDANDAGAKIDAIRIRQFDWKSEYGGAHQDYGLIAQELQPVAPEAVSEGYTEEDMMSVDYAKLVPTLIKEIQSLRSRVAELENN